MTLEELKNELSMVNQEYAEDSEYCHRFIDELLLEYINDETVTRRFNEVAKWYA